MPDKEVYLVTGAAGFIGSHLVEELLRRGENVRGLDDFSTGHRKNLEDVREAVGDEAWRRFSFLEGDIRNLETCRRSCKGVAHVLHQAALGSVPRSIEDPLRTHSVNVDGFINMLVAARDAGVGRFVFASSSSVYGDDESLPKIEERIGTPVSPYGVSKRTNELYAQTFQEHYGFETVGLRYFNVFGPRQDPNGPYAAVIPKWIDMLATGQPCTIHGDGETSRDFCYVANTVQANLLAAVAPGTATGRVYNVACGRQISLNQLFTAIRGAIGSRNGSSDLPSATYGPFRKGDIRHSLADVNAAARLLGYSPTHQAERGLDETVAWYLSMATATRGSATSDTEVATR